jgi:hypothetical protein
MGYIHCAPDLLSVDFYRQSDAVGPAVAGERLGVLNPLGVVPEFDVAIGDVVEPLFAALQESRSGA